MLKISHADKHYAIPIVSEHVYLGCVVTYASYEAATLQHRLSVGKERYRQLRKVVNSRKVLGRGHRLNIWFTCVWSTMQYGLTACGVLATGLKELQSVMMKHVRAISAMPAHLTHVSDNELCVINLAFRFQVPCFYDQLRRCRQDFGKISSTCQLRNDLSIVRAGYRLFGSLRPQANMEYCNLLRMPH